MIANESGHNAAVSVRRDEPPVEHVDDGLRWILTDCLRGHLNRDIANFSHAVPSGHIVRSVMVTLIAI